MSAAALATGQTVPSQRFGPFDADQVAGYAAASGDDNPLHREPALAARAGLARPPIHGMLIMGCFEPYLRAWRPEGEIVKLAAKFIRPVLVGEAILIVAKVVRAAAGEPAVMRLTVRNEADEIVCLAEAFLRP